MIKFLTALTLSFLFLMNSLHSEIVKSIQINGNKRVSVETVKICGNININEDYSESDLNKILTNLYSTTFFKNITIDLSNNILKINLEEFPIINQLIITGEPKQKLVDEIKKLMKSKQKGSYIESNLAKDVDTIKNIYSSGLKGIIIEKNNSFIVNPECTFKLIKKYNLFYYAI